MHFYILSSFFDVHYGQSWCTFVTVDSGNSKRLNSKQSLISKLFGETGRLFYNINYMLNSEHLSLVSKIGDKTEFIITRVHCST